MQESYSERLNIFIHGIEEDEDSVWESHQKIPEKFDEFLKNALESIMVNSLNYPKGHTGYSSITDHFLIACKVRQLNLFSRKMNTFFYRDKGKICSKTYCEEMYSKLANIVLSNFPFQRDKFNDVF